MTEPKDSGTAANIEKVKAAYEAFQNGDIDGIVDTFHPQASMVQAEGLPYGGTYFGPEAILEGLKLAISAWDRVHFQLEEVAGAGNLVFAYMHTVAKGKNTGKTRAFPGVEVFRFRDGQVVEFRPFYFDTARAKAVAGD